jgi:hypothetical protein
MISTRDNATSSVSAEAVVSNTAVLPANIETIIERSCLITERPTLAAVDSSLLASSHQAVSSSWVRPAIVEYTSEWLQALFNTFLEAIINRLTANSVFLSIYQLKWLNIYLVDSQSLRDDLHRRADTFKFLSAEDLALYKSGIDISSFVARLVTTKVKLFQLPTLVIPSGEALNSVSIESLIEVVELFGVALNDQLGPLLQYPVNIKANSSPQITIPPQSLAIIIPSHSVTPLDNDLPLAIIQPASPPQTSPNPAQVSSPSNLELPEGSLNQSVSRVSTGRNQALLITSDQAREEQLAPEASFSSLTLNVPSADEAGDQHQSAASALPPGIKPIHPERKAASKHLVKTVMPMRLKKYPAIEEKASVADESVASVDALFVAPNASSRSTVVSPKLTPSPDFLHERARRMAELSASPHSNWHSSFFRESMSSPVMVANDSQRSLQEAIARQLEVLVNTNDAGIRAMRAVTINPVLPITDYFQQLALIANDHQFLQQKRRLFFCCGGKVTPRPESLNQFFMTIAALNVSEITDNQAADLAARLNNIRHSDAPRPSSARQIMVGPIR